jgi:hypothetical protein
MTSFSFQLNSALEWMTWRKAAEGCRSPKPGGNSERAGQREASWSAPALWRFGTGGQPSRRSGVSAERRKPCRELVWRLSAESRYAKPQSECRRGNGSRRLGARSLAMTEIRLVALKSHESGCRRTCRAVALRSRTYLRTLAQCLRPVHPRITSYYRKAILISW